MINYFEMFEQLLFDRGLFRELNKTIGSDIQEEHFEVIKGDYKTNLTARFTKEGQCIGYAFTSTKMNKEQEPDLQKQLDQALQEENYELAADIKKRMLTEQKQITN